MKPALCIMFEVQLALTLFLVEEGEEGEEGDEAKLGFVGRMEWVLLTVDCSLPSASSW